MASPEITIRRMLPADYPAVVSLWKDVGLVFKPGGRDTMEKISREIAGPTSEFLVAVCNGEICGTVFGTHDGRKGWINRLAVSESFQHQGLAQRLILAVEDRLEAKGIEIIACLIDDLNEGSKSLFRKAGYTEHQDIIYFARKKYPQV